MRVRFVWCVREDIQLGVRTYRNKSNVCLPHSPRQRASSTGAGVAADFTLAGNHDPQRACADVAEGVVVHLFRVFGSCRTVKGWFVDSDAS